MIELVQTRYPRVLAVLLHDQHIGHVRRDGPTWSAALATEPASKDQPARTLQTARYLDGVHDTPEEAADAVVDAWSPE